MNQCFKESLGPATLKKQTLLKPGWRKLHNEVLYHLHSSQNITTMNKTRRIGEACSARGEDKCVHNFVWKD
jgi:hypothetical protein